MLLQPHFRDRICPDRDFSLANSVGMAQLHLLEEQMSYYDSSPFSERFNGAHNPFF